MQQSEDYSTYYMNPPGHSEEHGGQYTHAHNKTTRRNDPCTAGEGCRWRTHRYRSPVRCRRGRHDGCASTEVLATEEYANGLYICQMDHMEYARCHGGVGCAEINGQVEGSRGAVAYRCSRCPIIVACKTSRSALIIVFQRKTVTMHDPQGVGLVRCSRS